MDRKKFLKTCGTMVAGVTLSSWMWQGCGSIHYAASTKKAGQLIVSKSEFLEKRSNKTVERKFILVTPTAAAPPIGIYKSDKDTYIAALLKCTHRGCELNPGGNIYSCPCHGSEFSMEGKVLEGPAEEHLKIYNTTTDAKNIYIEIH